MSNLEELQSGLARLVGRVEELEKGQAHDTESLGRQPTPADDVEPVYASAEEWVNEWLSKVFGRRLGPTTRWCRRWREHPEACWRLEGMWRSWEASRYDIWLGVSTWVNNHFDPSWAVLTGPDGTFRGCDHENHIVQSDLPTVVKPINGSAVEAGVAS